MEVEKMCRLCAFRLHKSHNIFATSGLRDKILKFTDIQIREGDGLPSSICDLCNIKLQISDKFRHQVGRTDKLIRACVPAQNAESNDTRRSADSTENIPINNNTVPKYLANDFRPQSNLRKEICRERMRLSERRPCDRKYSQSLKMSMKSSARSLIYSYSTARSLVASYKCLINRCRTQGFLEEFTLPSSFVSSDYESDGRDVDECTARFTAARQRLLEKRRMQIYLKDKESISSCKNVANNHLIDLISPRVQADPLNLLKIKSVQPLVDEDCSSCSSADSCTDVPEISRTASQRPDYRICGTPGYCRRFVIEDLEENCSTESVFSDSNLSEESRRSSSSSISKSTIEGNEEHPERDSNANSSSNFATVVDDDGCNDETLRNKQSGAQCPICDRICVSERGLKIHFRIHRSRKCQICDVGTETNEKFRDHMMQVHFKPMNNTPIFNCTICKNIFKTHVGLNAHMRVHSKSVPAVKDCPHCTKTFASIRGFKIHLSKCHSGFETG